MRPGELASLPDEDLMALVQQDEEAAYRHLVERHVQRMHRLAVRVLSDSAQAEDAVQDAFLQVWIKRADWRNDGARFATWLYRIVFNRCLDVKRRRREAALDEDDDRPKVSEYRGLKVCRFDDARLAQLDDWLLISNKSELAKWIADGWLDGTADSLAETRSIGPPPRVCRPRRPRRCGSI